MPKFSSSQSTSASRPRTGNLPEHQYDQSHESDCFYGGQPVTIVAMTLGKTRVLPTRGVNRGRVILRSFFPTTTRATVLDGGALRSRVSTKSARTGTAVNPWLTFEA